MGTMLRKKLRNDGSSRNKNSNRLDIFLYFDPMFNPSYLLTSNYICYDQKIRRSLSISVIDLSSQGPMIDLVVAQRHT